MDFMVKRLKKKSHWNGLKVFVDNLYDNAEALMETNFGKKI